MNKFYITTAIDYPNGKPHIGHSYEKVAADVLARFHRAKGAETFFLTGTDEHGAKIAQYAKAAGKSEQEYVDEFSGYFSFAWDQLSVAPDRFIRTTDEDHVKTVLDLITRIKDNGHLYEGDYEGLYCIGHEAFLTEKDLVNGLCPEHQKAPELIKEKNWFFRISSFTDEIRKKIESDELKVWPEASRNEILSWLNQGFKDIAVTRPNVKWGIPVPWDSEQTVYVWVDALINYVSGAGYVNNPEQYEKLWPADLHVIGRDIAKFHCIIWPALLLAAGLEVPRAIAVHGYLTLNNQKISKSLGNVVDPNDWVVKYGSDVVRYFLLREVPFGSDGDVSEEKLNARYNGDLADGLGNLLSRITNLVEKNLNGDIGQEVALPDEAGPSDIDLDVVNFKFHDALAKIWGYVSLGNKIVDEEKLWNLAKTDTDSFRKFSHAVLVILLRVSKELAPFMPDTAQRIFEAVTTKKIIKAEPLFPKVVFPVPGDTVGISETVSIEIKNS